MHPATSGAQIDEIEIVSSQEVVPDFVVKILFRKKKNDWWNLIVMVPGVKFLRPQQTRGQPKMIRRCRLSWNGNRIGTTPEWKWLMEKFPEVAAWVEKTLPQIEWSRYA
jgi:hypothetical protein